MSDPLAEPGPALMQATRTAMDLGATPDQVFDVAMEIHVLFLEAVTRPESFDKRKVRLVMDYAMIGLLHERGLIP